MQRLSPESRQILPPPKAEANVVRLGFEDLVEGQSYGPFGFRVTAEICDQMRGPVGEGRPGAAAPPAVVNVLFLQAYRRAYGGIPAGGVLASERIEQIAPIAVDAEVDVTVTVAETLRRKGRPRARFRFDIADPAGKPLAGGELEISWATDEELEEGGGDDG